MSVVLHQLWHLLLGRNCVCGCLHAHVVHTLLCPFIRPVSLGSSCVKCFCLACHAYCHQSLADFDTCCCRMGGMDEYGMSMGGGFGGGMRGRGGGYGRGGMGNMRGGMGSMGGMGGGMGGGFGGMGDGGMGDGIGGMGRGGFSRGGMRWVGAAGVAFFSFLILVDLLLNVFFCVCFLFLYLSLVAHLQFLTSMKKQRTACNWCRTTRC